MTIKQHNERIDGIYKRLSYYLTLSLSRYKKAKRENDKYEIAYFRQDIRTHIMILRTFKDEVNGW